MSQNRNPEADGTAGKKIYLRTNTRTKITEKICLFSLIIRFSDSPEHKGLQLRTVVSGPRRYSRNLRNFYDLIKNLNV
jgi:hypothetical protein